MCEDPVNSSSSSRSYISSSNSENAGVQENGAGMLILCNIVHHNWFMEFVSGSMNSYLVRNEQLYVVGHYNISSVPGTNIV